MPGVQPGFVPRRPAPIRAEEAGRGVACAFPPDAPEEPAALSPRRRPPRRVVASDAARSAGGGGRSDFTVRDTSREFIDTGMNAELDGGITPTGPVVPVGVNAPNVYRLESDGVAFEYMGSLQGIVDDLDVETGVANPTDVSAPYTRYGLGLSFLRQPTNADLTWLPASSGTGIPVYERNIEGAPRGVPHSSATRTLRAKDHRTEAVRRDNLYWLLYDEHWDALHDMFVALGSTDRPVKVVLTWLTLGINDPAGTWQDPIGEFKSDRVVHQLWEAAHDASTTIGWSSTADPSVFEQVDIHDFAYQVAGVDYESTRDPNGFSHNVLDPRSRYKLYYYFRMGAAVARLLLDLQESLNAEFGEHAAPVLRDLVLAMEMGNELNQADLPAAVNPFRTRSGDSFGRDREWVPTIAEHATYWARVVREGARGIQTVLSRDAATDIPLWLPSLAMYFRMAWDSSESVEAPPSFSDVSEWQNAFASALRSVNGVDGWENPDGEASPAGSGPIALDWFTNQDYHYYHYKSGQRAGFIGRLDAEVRQLEANLGDAYLCDEDGCEGGQTVSVCETGASSWSNGSEDDVDLAAYPYLAAAAAAGRLPEALDRFEAREVWRRLAVGLGCASHVAWHSHLVAESSGFRGMGLRLDAPTQANAASEQGKLAWWAMQRLLRVLVPAGGSGAVPGTATLPAVHPDYAAWWWYASTVAVDGYGLDTADARDMVVMVSFAPATLGSYAYLLFVDPIADTSLRVRVTVTNTGEESGMGGNVWQIPTVPESAGAVTFAPAPPGAFPVEAEGASWTRTGRTWSYDQTSFQLGLVPDQDPILLVSQYQLTFRWTTL